MYNKLVVKQINKIQKGLIPNGWKTWYNSCRGIDKHTIGVHRLQMWLGYEVWKDWLQSHNESITIDEVTAEIIKGINLTQNNYTQNEYDNRILNEF